VTALLLARAGRRVLLADCSSDAVRTGEALPPAARPLLRDLGLLPWVLAAGDTPCVGNASAWGSHDLSLSDFIFNVYGTGLHLDRAAFDASLRAAAAAAGATLVCARVARQGGLRLRSRKGDEPLTSRWIVDASGRAAVCAHARGATRTRDDRLVAFHGRFVPARGCSDSDGRTLIESSPDGWWYTALLPSGARVVAFLTDRDLAPRQQLLSAAGLLAGIDRTRHIRDVVRAHGYTLSGSLRGVDAASSRLDIFAGGDWLAVGDAALAFDPLSSQGIFNALYTGMEAGRALDAALSGDEGAVGRYTARLEEIYGAYRRNLLAFYGSETRWPDQPFWRRRAA